MQTSIDNFGRITIPKSIRDHLGLQPGSILNIEEGEYEIFLKMSEDKPALKMEEGMLVFTGKPIGDIENTLASVREARLKGLEGF